MLAFQGDLNGCGRASSWKCLQERCTSLPAWLPSPAGTSAPATSSPSSSFVVVLAPCPPPNVLTGHVGLQVAAMQKRIWSPAVRRSLIFPQPAEEGDAFHYVLRELARKLEERREKKSKPKPKKKIASKALPAGTKTGPLRTFR